MDGFYALFNLVVFAEPLIFTLVFMPWFWRQWQVVLGVFVFVALPWLWLDTISFARGWWNYNEAFIFGPRLFNLPLEEVCFFVSVPFAAMVVWALINYKVPGTVKKGRARLGLAFIAAAALIFVAVFFRERTVVEVLLLLATVSILWFSPIIYTRAFWWWNLTSLGLLLLFQTVLAGMPVFLYNDTFASGIRVGTIPLEDFLYNFSLLNMVALAFSSFRRSPIDKK